MYNKLFTKILDSSIWLSPDPQRIVWITLIAAMDEDGIAQFASVANLAHRARVSLQDAQEAVTAFESPDPHDPTQDFDGRRIERVPGGWLILNAAKYRAIVTKAVSREQTRLRVKKFRESRRNADVRKCNADVTPSEAEAEAEAEADSGSSSRSRGVYTPSSLSSSARDPLKGVIRELAKSKKLK